MSKDCLIHEVYLLKLLGQRVRITHQRGNPKISGRPVQGQR